MLGLIKKIGEEEKKERGEGNLRVNGGGIYRRKRGEEQVDEKYYYCFS